MFFSDDQAAGCKTAKNKKCRSIYFSDLAAFEASIDLLQYLQWHTVLHPAKQYV